MGFYTGLERPKSLPLPSDCVTSLHNPENVSEDQTFRGKEIEALLGAAARLQEKEGGSPHGVGLTLKEIEAIAAESGIDPAFVRQAALVQTSATDEDDGFFFFGGPGTIRRKMTLRRRLSTTEMEKLVPAFRRIMENEGSADSLHNSLSWSTSEGKGHAGTSVMMEADGNRTTVTLKASLLLPGFLIHYVPLILVVLIGLPLGAPNLFSPTALSIKLAALALVFLMTRVGFGAVYRKKRKQLDEIQQVIEDAARADEEHSEGVRGAEDATVRDTEIAGAADEKAPLKGRIELDDDDLRLGSESRPPERGRLKD